MADQIVAVPQAISAAADGADHEIVFHTEFNQLMEARQAAFIKIVSGTFKFNVGGSTTESNASFTSSDTVPPIPFINGNSGFNIVYRCTSAGSFVISFL